MLNSSVQNRHLARSPKGRSPWFTHTQRYGEVCPIVSECGTRAKAHNDSESEYCRGSEVSGDTFYFFWMCSWSRGTRITKEAEAASTNRYAL
jgi:hypothetical protein